MSHAEKCPVCDGVGSIPEQTPYDGSAYIPRNVICHGCSGLGWVTVQDEPSEQVRTFYPTKTAVGGANV